MKYFVLLTGLILACYLLGFIKKPEKYQWMDRNYTTAIKGFSILTVRAVQKCVLVGDFWNGSDGHPECDKNRQEKNNDS